MRIRYALIGITVVALVNGTALPHGSGLSARARDSTLPGVLLGRWRSEAVHHHADGTKLRERGTIKCAWILERTYLQCERRYRAQTGARRHSLQLYALDSSGLLVEVLTIYAGRTMRVLQSVRVISGSSISLTGMIRLHNGRSVETRGQMTLVSGTRVLYRNETEESPGQWRVDYEETYTRQR